MTASSAQPGAPLSVLIACAPEDAPTARALVQRLRTDGLDVTLLAQATPARAMRETLGTAEAVVVCLSRRALPDGAPVPFLAHLLELLALAPAPTRLTLALRLTSCELPAPLKHTPALDLFSASGYERLLSALRDHAAAIAPAPAPAPEDPPDPPPPASPVLALRGVFGLPLLDRQGLVRRLGRGVARALFLPDRGLALVVSGGGPALANLSGGPPLWAIDCPTRCAALSPSGRLLALAAETQIFLWDLSDGSLRGVYTGHAATVSGLAFAPDERTLASASHDRSVRLWRTGDDGRPPALLAALPDHGDQVTCVAFSPNGALLATGGADRTVRVWRTFDRVGIQTLPSHGGAIEALAFSPDGKTLAAGSRGRLARLWDTQTWRAVTLEGHEGAVEALAFSPDSALVATGATDNQVRLWRSSDGALTRVLPGHAGPVTSLAFSPDGAILASVGEDERLIAWQVDEGAQTTTLHPLSGRVTSLALSADGEQLAIGSSSGSLAVYGLEEDRGARMRQNQHRSAVIAAAFAGPAHLVTAAADRTLRLCALADGQAVIMLQTHGALHAAALAPGGGLLANTDGENTIQLWRLAGPAATAGGAFWRVLRGLRGRPRLIAFGPRAEAVAVAADDGQVYLWRIPSLERDGAEPELSLSFGGGRARSLAFNGNGELLAVGGDGGAVQIWRSADGAVVANPSGSGRPINALAFAPDGRALASGDSGGTIRVWRIGAGEGRRRPPTVLLAHAGSVDHLAYSPAGRLVSGSADGTVRVWSV